MQPSAAWAVAAGLAGLAETAAFNALTVRRSRAHAGTGPPPRETLRAMAGRGLWALMAVTASRRAFSYGLQTALAGWGMASNVAGAIAGGLDGLVFMPTRRVVVAQQGYSQERSAWSILADHRRVYGFAALWHGAHVGVLRGAAGGAVFFGTLAALRAHTGWPAVLVGLAASVVTAIAVNPLEVLVTLLAAPREAAVRPAQLMRGVGEAIIRTVPSSTIGYWLTDALASRLGA